MKITFRLLLAVVLVSGTTKSLMAQKVHPTLNHIAVYVHNLQTMAAFYHHILNLDTVPEPFHDGRHAWFDIGPGCRLHLIQGAAAITTHDKNGHLCFSVADINDFITVLKQNKLEYENWAGEKNSLTHRPDGVTQIYFKDPEGYWLEVNDAKE